MKTKTFMIFIFLIIAAICNGQNQSYSGQCKGITQKGARCKRMVSNSNGYCWQHQSQVTASVTTEKQKADTTTKKKNSSTTEKKVNSSNKKQSGDTYNGHQVQTGPRGGRYYINSHGNKTYIKRK